MTSAEEAEYLIRALLLGFFIYYTPNVVVFHKTWQQSDDLEMSRVFGNRKAFGYILRKYEFPKSFALNKLVRSIGGMCFFALRGNLRRTRYYCRAFLGLANGWLSYSSCEWREPRASLVPRTAQVELRSRAGTDLGR